MNQFMNRLKDILSNRRLLIKIGGIIAGVILFIFLLVFIIKVINRKITYAALEDQLITATANYLKDHPEYYPTASSPSFTIAGETLVNEKYMKKELNKLVKDNCSAEIQVLYKNESYQVKPFLTCDKYETREFYDKVLADSPVTEDGSGLYDLNEKLVFRGDQPNNYVKFNNVLWRIVKMDPADSTIYLIIENLKDVKLDIWDNRYNTTEESRHGINDYNVSVIADTLSRVYQENFSNLKSYLVPMDVCIGKRSETEERNDGSVECSNIMMEKQYIALLPLYEYISASTDYQCKSAADRACANYNYLVNKVGKWWTITGDGSRITKVYGINYSGVITSDFADTKKYIRFVIAIDGTMLYREGNGTASNPYVFK